MKKISRAVLLGISLLSSTQAQNSLPHETPNQHSTTYFERFARELILHQLDADHARAAAQDAERREAHYRERQFIDKVDQFVGSWSRFVSLYNDRKAFDIKAAKEVSKAFHELESSGDWPKIDRK